MVPVVYKDGLMSIPHFLYLVQEAYMYFLVVPRGGGRLFHTSGGQINYHVIFKNIKNYH